MYPFVSDYINSQNQTKLIETYNQAVSEFDKADYEKMMKDARDYNKRLYEQIQDFKLSDKEKEQYNSLLNIAGDGVMGYVEIPSIDCKLPIYHGTDDTVLQVATGHMEWSSLPVGGESTHCVISGHRGLPSAVLFSNLDLLSEGDIFRLNVLDELLSYQVDQIRVVDKWETDDLMIEEGKDYCSLVTCTPYGVNSQRLIVRGHRVPNEDNTKPPRITSNAYQFEPMTVALCMGIPILIIVFIISMIPRRRNED